MKIIKFFSLFILSVAMFSNCSKTDIVEPTNKQLEKEVIGPSIEMTESNLIKNADMENGQNNYWKGGVTNNNYTHLYTDKESNSSSHSLRIDANNAEENQFAFWAQTIEVAGLTGKKFIANVSTKFSGVDGNGVILVIRGDDTITPSGKAEAFATTQSRFTKVGNGDWQTLEIELDNLPDGIKSITVYMILGAENGTVYFDDLSLITVNGSGPIYNLKNTDLESSSLFAKYWWNGASNRDLFDIDFVDNESLSSSHSIKISSINSGPEFSFWAQTILADHFVGKSINLNVNIKAENITGKGIAIAIRGDDTDRPHDRAEIFSTTQFEKLITGSFDWKSYNVKLDNIPSNIKCITIYLIYLNNTSGTVYFDDVSLN